MFSIGDRVQVCDNPNYSTRGCKGTVIAKNKDGWPYEVRLDNHPFVRTMFYFEDDLTKIKE